MATPLTASMPQFADLPYGATVVLEALDPTTGDAVTGVTFTKVSIWADVEDAGGAATSGPFMLVPGPSA